MGTKKFSQAISKGDLELKQASGESLPYEDNTFTKICTVNTIYFWSNPQAVLKKCDRLLQLQRSIFSYVLPKLNKVRALHILSPIYRAISNDC